MGGKKKQAHNSFYYFMLDFRKKEESKGRTFNGMTEVSEAAGALWGHLPRDEKRIYEVRANEAKNKVTGAKYNSLGEDIDVLTKREEQAKIKQKKMEYYIKNLVQDALDGNVFVDKYFIVGYVNHYVFHNASNRYLPAEISLVRFSLRDGIYQQDLFHQIIAPGQIPIGYRHMAKTHCDQTHQLPLPAVDGYPEEDVPGRTGIRVVFRDIIEYLKKYSDDPAMLPPIFVDDKNFEVADNVFRNLSISAGYREDYLRTYSLSFLYYTLRNASHLNVSNGPAFPTVSFSIEQLEIDIYDNVRGISCQYHDVTDVFSECSMAKAIRKIYIICDNCCQDLRIELVHGRHVPATAITDRSRQGGRVISFKNPKPAPLLFNSSIKTSPNAEETLKEIEDVSSVLSEITIRNPTTKSIAESKMPFTPNEGIASFSEGLPSSGRGRGRQLPEWAPASTSLPPLSEWPSLGACGISRGANRRGRGRYGVKDN